MDGIRYWIETEGSGNWFFLSFPVVLLCLFIWFKGRRVRFLIPSLLISIVIINPWFYRAWDKLGLYAYWRILWVVPVVPVVAGLVPSISEKFEKTWMKSIVAVAGVGMVVVGGTFLYNGAGGSFVEAANDAKLPDYVIQIADRLLELDEHPRVIAQDPIGVYIRQYTADITTLYGRDIAGKHVGKPSKNAVIVNSELTNQDADKITVFKIMLDDDFDYLVFNGNPGIYFELIESVGNYGFFKPIGKSNVIKKRNGLGQVIAITYVDENENPTIGEEGYVSVYFEYDENGFVSKIFHVDQYQNGMADEYGIAGYEREFDDKGNILLERTLGADGEPIQAFHNYADNVNHLGQLAPLFGGKRRRIAHIKSTVY